LGASLLKSFNFLAPMSVSVALLVGKFLAVALLDSTIKIFFADTLKFFLSLYGHKLPVLSMDISSDSTLLVSGSADKNIKIWGLDFGDCHKSLFAHGDSVMQVAFVPRTHYIFSVGEWPTHRLFQSRRCCVAGGKRLCELPRRGHDHSLVFHFVCSFRERQNVEVLGWGQV
jgi:WD40 repeat protein